MTAPVLRDRLGQIGVWSFRFEAMDPFEAADAARAVERLGFQALWVPEVGATEALSLAGHLLHATSDLVVANGIARLSDHSPSAAAAGHRYLDEASDGRHVLGLGLGGALSNGPAPLKVMSDYLDEFADAWDNHARAGERAPVVCLAAYNKHMAALAGERSDGIHTYLITPEHTAQVRAQVGSEPVLAAEMTAVFTDDADQARSVGRAHVSKYLSSTSHQRKFRTMGFNDEDLADGGSDRLIDELVVHGQASVAERISTHRTAGADHVAIQVLGTTSLAEDIEAWSTLASLVTD